MRHLTIRLPSNLHYGAAINLVLVKSFATCAHLERVVLCPDMAHENVAVLKQPWYFLPQIHTVFIAPHA